MIKTKIPDPEWMERLDEMGYTRNHLLSEEKKHLEPLKQKLLNIGGFAVVLFYLEEDLDKILQRGRKFSRTNRTMSGISGRCHENSALLWNNNKTTLKLCTGYALSNDGVWRQHSWCLFGRTKTVETTLPRVQYFGYILTPKEAEIFVYNNT